MEEIKLCKYCLKENLSDSDFCSSECYLKDKDKK